MNGWLAAVVGVLALAVSALGGWPLTAGVLRLAARSADAGPDGSDGSAAPGAPDGSTAATRPTGPGTPAPEPAGGPTGARARDALRGGTWIGILERLATTATLLVGYPSGIAFVIAVKGLGRYPELKENPAASERFVIGTLASMLWATVVGAAGRLLLLSAGG